MTAARATRWMYHMRGALESIKFEDPCIKPCIIDFLRTAMVQYTNDFGWKFDEGNMELYQQYQGDADKLAIRQPPVNLFRVEIWKPQANIETHSHTYPLSYCRRECRISTNEIDASSDVVVLSSSVSIVYFCVLCVLLCTLCTFVTFVYFCVLCLLLSHLSTSESFVYF
jgi:hypothetical protein